MPALVSSSDEGGPESHAESDDDESVGDADWSGCGAMALDEDAPPPRGPHAFSFSLPPTSQPLERPWSW